MSMSSIHSRISWLLIVCGLASGCSVVFAQAPDTVWTRTYGSACSAAGQCVYELADGGFIVGGNMMPTGEVYRDMYLVRTDSNGDTIWTRSIGASDRDEAIASMQLAPDGGFTMISNYDQAEPYTYNTNVYVLGTDSGGSVEWSTWFGIDSIGESAIWIAPTLDRGYIISSRYWGNSTTGWDMWLIKVGDTGWYQWDQRYEWGEADNIACAIQTSGGGYAVTGYTQSNDVEYDYDIFLLLLDSDGDSVWCRTYGYDHPYDEGPYHVCETSDGGFLISGYRSDPSTPKDMLVIKTDSDGHTEWSTQLGGTYHDQAVYGIETSDGGYAAVGSWHQGSWDVALVKFDDAGDTLWTAFWGDTLRNETPRALLQARDGGFVVTGWTTPDWEAFLIKFGGDPLVYDHTWGLSGVGEAISNGSTAHSTIAVDVSGMIPPPGPLVGVKVYLDTILHDEVGDLTISLEHDGVDVTLLSHPTYGGANFIGTILNDAAGSPIASGAAPFTGSFRPEQQLSAFAGHDPNGDWTLHIADDIAGNDGTLQAWGLTLLFDTPTDVEDAPSGLPTAFTLEQNYPNPFNPATSFEYSLAVRSYVTIEVFNTLGRRVRKLVSENKPAGTYTARWDGTDSRGETVASGVYFYRLSADDEVLSKKMILLK